MRFYGTKKIRGFRTARTPSSWRNDYHSGDRHLNGRIASRTCEQRRSPQRVRSLPVGTAAAAAAAGAACPGTAAAAAAGELPRLEYARSRGHI